MTEFWYALGDFFYAIFGMMDKIQDLPNTIFIILGFALFALWMKMQADFNRKAREQGGLK